MRLKGTKYPTIDKLPVNAQPVSLFASENDMQVGHVYIKFDRYTTGASTLKPKYIIRQFQGTNYVIPNN